VSGDPRHTPRHHHGHHRRTRPHRPGRYEVHKVRRRGQALTIAVLAGGLLVLLVVLVRLLGGDRDDASFELTRPSGSAPRQ
jgi:hypothetical protein